LNDLERNHQKLSESVNINLFNFDEYVEEEIITKEENEIIKELKEVSIEELTPLEALNILNKIINKI
jgi:DNA mismatch repair protein MutS